MKSLSLRRHRGFTLVELLVVITIIAILAAAGFGAGTAAINKAKKVKALGVCVAIQQAVNQFYNEYGTLPTVEPADTTLKTNEGDAEGVKLLTVLMGLDETVTPPMNTRAVKFLQAAEGKAKKNGVIYSGDGKSVTGLYDPWGGPYYIIIDGDSDERITPTPPGGTAPTLNGTKVAVWSNGADGVNGGGKPADDVKTW